VFLTLSVYVFFSFFELCVQRSGQIQTPSLRQPSQEGIRTKRTTENCTCLLNLRWTKLANRQALDETECWTCFLYLSVHGKRLTWFSSFLNFTYNVQPTTHNVFFGINVFFSDSRFSFLRWTVDEASALDDGRGFFLGLSDSRISVF
jgi:hypothetical protein